MPNMWKETVFLICATLIHLAEIFEKVIQLLRQESYCSRQAILIALCLPIKLRISSTTAFSVFLSYTQSLEIAESMKQEQGTLGKPTTLVPTRRKSSSWQVLAEEFEPSETVIYRGTTINTETQKWSKKVALANYDYMFVLFPHVFHSMRLTLVLVITRFSVTAKYQNFDPIGLMNIMSLLPSLCKFDCSMKVPKHQRSKLRLSWWMFHCMDIWPQ